jgi:hypothetical protein
VKLFWGLKCRNNRPIGHIPGDNTTQEAFATDELHTRFDPVAPVEAQHEPTLIVEFLIVPRSENLCREIPIGTFKTEVTVVPDEAVVGLPPKIGFSPVVTCRMPLSILQCGGSLNQFILSP